MKEFKIGDVVRLKGFHLAMTVEDLNAADGRDEGLVRCVWFDLELHIQEELFKKEVLEMVPEE